MDKCWNHDLHYLSDLHVHAHETDDQLPLIAQVGRGLKGDSFRVIIKNDDPDTEAYTRLEGQYYKEDIKTWQQAWVSENINGGRLHCYYHLNPNDVPKTFKMIWVYKRTDRPYSEWSWVTPAIPYSYFDKNIMGTSVGDLFLKDHKYTSGTSVENDKYIDMLTYPNYNHDVPTIDRDDFNAPYPPGGKDKVNFPTTAGIRKGPKIETPGSTYQYGSEWNVYLDIPNMDELVKITGISRPNLIKIINDVTKAITPNMTGRTTYFKTDFANIKSDNIKDYIEDMAEQENKLRHQEDERIEAKLDDEIARAKAAEQNLQNQINVLITQYDSLLKKVVEYFYGGTWTPRSGNTAPSITFRSGTKAATGEINVHGWPNGSGGGSIKTHDGDKSGDIKAI